MQLDASSGTQILYECSSVFPFKCFRVDGQSTVFWTVLFLADSGHVAPKAAAISVARTTKMVSSFSTLIRTNVDFSEIVSWKCVWSNGNGNGGKQHCVIQFLSRASDKLCNAELSNTELSIRTDKSVIFNHLQMTLKSHIMCDSEY